jgi:cysteine desulfurase
MDQEFGNEGSRTHAFGMRAKQAVLKAREEVASVVGASKDEVIFTSGATESNNLAIFGIKEWAKRNNKKHIISTAIEHKAILEPLEKLAKEGFDVDLIPPERNGIISPQKIHRAVRKDTFLISVMHANNETGAVQPINEIADKIRHTDAILHVDAAQTFGKVFGILDNKRINMISVSAHKIFGPKGIGALIYREGQVSEKVLEPLILGGGQEMGFRSGTLPVHLIVGFGKASGLALKNYKKRNKKNIEYRQQITTIFGRYDFCLNGDDKNTLPHVLNFSIPTITSEALIIALKDVIAISNGSACTSTSYKNSYVLQAMGLEEDKIKGSVRLSWCHLTPSLEGNLVDKALSVLLG